MGDHLESLGAPDTGSILGYRAQVVINFSVVVSAVFAVVLRLILILVTVW